MSHIDNFHNTGFAIQQADEGGGKKFTHEGSVQDHIDHPDKYPQGYLRIYQIKDTVNHGRNHCGSITLAQNVKNGKKQQIIGQLFDEHQISAYSRCLLRKRTYLVIAEPKSIDTLVYPRLDFFGNS